MSSSRSFNSSNPGKLLVRAGERARREAPLRDAAGSGEWFGFVSTPALRAGGGKRRSNGSGI
jgi:hypothetical protein